MNNFFRRWLALFVLLLGAAVPAHAERAGVPVVDFKDIPVSLGSSKPLTAEQVRQAFMRSAEAERWDVTPLPDGTLQMSSVKNGKHTIVIVVTYSADSYSARYVRSEQLGYFEIGPGLPALSAQGLAAARAALVKQRTRFASLPEHKFTVERENTFIHPNCEVWMHDLMGGVRRQLSTF